ncbi:MAG: T9SS type A sorting domain-containing protein [Bacteroidetes bacterium]|nr:T9SS type A sorting domain-containing protein [Bacteroidota bacterium]
MKFPYVNTFLLSIFLLIACPSFVRAQNIISTAFGTGVAGSAGDSGLARNAEFNGPYGLCISPSGDIYIAEYNGGRVRKINADGIVTTVAGTGSIGVFGDGGPAINATLINPTGLCLDKKGNLYIADYHTNTVRKVNSSTGIITTIAGDTLSWRHENTGDGGPATAAHLQGPTDLCIDSIGDLYIVDDIAVRKIDTAGIISTVVRNLHFASSICIDKHNNLYIADEFNFVVKKYDAVLDSVYVIAGNIGVRGYSGDSDLANKALLGKPKYLFLDSAENLYITDAGDYLVRKIDAATGKIYTVAGQFGLQGYSGDGGLATNAEFCLPFGCVTDKQGNIFIADECDNVIRKINVTTTISGTIYRDTVTAPAFSFFKVLLIKYDSVTGIISAVDSTYTNGKGSSFYTFGAEPTGNYLVKAFITNNDTSGIGYVPGYSDSSLYWNAAKTVSYTSGTPVTANIYLKKDSLTSGPGFISGSVLLGAGKTTGGSVGDPVSGLTIYLEDASGKLIKHTVTNDSGKYSFDNLPANSYSVFPEDLGFKTIPYPVTIGGASLRFTYANFKKTSKYIEPAYTGVSIVDNTPGISVSPNPGNGKFLLQWDNLSSVSEIVVTDITGRQVFNQPLSAKSGRTILNISNLVSGVYFLELTGDNVRLVRKLIIQH